MPRRIDVAPDAAGRGVADQHHGAHVGHLGPRLGQCHCLDAFLWRRHSAGEGDQPIGTAGLAQDFQRACELMRAGGGAGIVERHREVGFRGEPKPPFHQRPRLEIVTEVDRAEVVAERRAGAGGCGQHRRDAGQHADIEVVQRGDFFQCFEHG